MKNKLKKPDDAPEMETRLLKRGIGALAWIAVLWYFVFSPLFSSDKKPDTDLVPNSSQPTLLEQLSNEHGEPSLSEEQKLSKFLAADKAGLRELADACKEAIQEEAGAGYYIKYLTPTGYGAIEGAAFGLESKKFAKSVANDYQTGTDIDADFMKDLKRAQAEKSMPYLMAKVAMGEAADIHWPTYITEFSCRLDYNNLMSASRSNLVSLD